MNNLMPEKRLDRLGRLVTRWVKGDPTPANQSILGTILPVIPNATTQYLTETAAADKELRTELLERLHVTLIEETEDQFARAGVSGHPQENSLTQHRINSIIRTMHKMDTATLQVIRDSPCDKSALAAFFSITPEEAALREQIHYMSPAMANRETSSFDKMMFDPIRKVLEVDDLSDYPRGSTEYESVLSTLQVMMTNWGIRTDKEDYRWPEEGTEERNVRTLLEIVKGHPEKAAQIRTFLAQRKTTLEDMDPTLLDDYLNSQTPALGGGML